jgi:hypothetical protein
MLRSLPWFVILWACSVDLAGTTACGAIPERCTVKVGASEVPKDIAEPVRALLSDQAVQVFDEQGKLFCELWLRKEFTVKATAADVKKGIEYRKFEESTIFGAVRFAQTWTSFRKQTIKPGLYTLRLGFQPMDGDHQGSAPFNEFLLLSLPGDDRKANIMSHKEVTEMSSKTIPGGTHPAVLLLFPNPKPEDKPQLVNKGSMIWVLNLKSDVAGGGEKGVLGVGLTLFGATTLE